MTKAEASLKFLVMFKNGFITSEQLTGCLDWDESVISEVLEQLDRT